MKLIIAMVIGFLLFNVSAGMTESNDPIAEWEQNRSRLLEEMSALDTPALIEQLGASSSMTRVAAFIALKERGSEEVIPQMMNVRDADHLYVFSPWLAINRLWGESAVPVLIPYVDVDHLNPENEIQGSWTALDALAEIGHPSREIVPLLLESLENPVDQVSFYHRDQCEVLWAIAEPSDEVIEAFVRLVENKDLEWIIDSACYALGDLASSDNEEVIASLEALVEREMSNEHRSPGWLSSGELAARAALWKLGVNQEENYRVISDEAETGTYAFAALAYIGNDQSFELVCRTILESNDLLTLMPAFKNINSFGQQERVIECLKEALNRPTLYFPDDGPPSTEPPEVESDGSWAFDIGAYALWHIARVGAEPEDILPEMIEFYQGRSENMSGEDAQEELDDMLQDLLWAYEGLSGRD